MNKLIKRFQNIVRIFLTEFVYGGHLLSIGGIGIILTIILIYNLPINIAAIIIPYLSSQIVYTYNHFREVDLDMDSNPERANHIRHQRNRIKYLLVFYSLLLLFTLFNTNVPTTLFVLGIVLGGILYTEYFKGLTAGLIAGFKNFYTSFFWASIVFLIPTIYNKQIDLSLLYIFLFVFLRWIVNSAFFDIKDITSDKKENLKTFAVILGKKKAIYTLHIINAISILPILIGTYYSIIDKRSLLLTFLIFYGFYYLSRALYINGRKLRRLSYIVVDAEYLFWPLLLCIGNLIIK